MKYLISFIIKRIPRPLLQRFAHFFLKFIKIFYYGHQVECPVCGKWFRRFLPYGRIPRVNVLCPECLSLERHRLIWLYLQQKTNFFQSQLKVLHIAPEHCFLPRFTKMQNLEYITADLESPLAQVKMDIHSIPFAENSFDVVFCNHVMEHVEDDIRAMSEIYRVLKPSGWAIIQSPQNKELKNTYEDPAITKPLDREKHFGQRDHLRMYGKDYGLRLRSAGFKVTEENFVKQLPLEIQQRNALPVSEIIYLCEK